MPKHKRKFISKKEGITFHLVNRSQQDPLIADENAPQRVLVPQKAKKNTEEEHKYGIFFDDEYDYLQHLKSSSDTNVELEQVHYKTNDKSKKNVSGAKVQLPSSVFESEVEEPVGMLNKAAPIHGPRPELDPDIVAALDEDFDYDDPDNLLEDNFIELANQEGDEEYEDDDDDLEDFDEDEEYEEDDDVPSLDGDRDFMEEETKSRFTNYSMTSSVMRRNEQLILLDNRFEKMFKGYEENEIGALDCEEIEGFLSPQDEMLLRLAEESKKEKTNELSIREKILAVLDDDKSSDEEMDKIVIQKGEKWDCESILSTYSNLYNHPAKITEPKGPGKIKVSKKTGIPLGVIGANTLTAHNLSLLDQGGISAGPRSVISQLSELSIRPKDESPEERRIRKKNLKNYRKERRLEKKANTLAFKEEKLRQEKVLLNQKNNQQGMKIL